MEKQMIQLDSGHEVHRNMTWEVVLIAGKGGCVWDFEKWGIGDVFNYGGRTGRVMVKGRAGLDSGH